jgi:hypothetical protein
MSSQLYCPYSRQAACRFYPRIPGTSRHLFCRIPSREEAGSRHEEGGMFCRIPGRWQGECNFVVQAGAEKVWKKAGYTARIPSRLHAGFTSEFQASVLSYSRQGRSRFQGGLYYRIPGRWQGGCTFVVLAFPSGGPDPNGLSNFLVSAPSPCCTGDLNLCPPDLE